MPFGQHKYWIVSVTSKKAILIVFNTVIDMHHLPCLCCPVREQRFSCKSHRRCNSSRSLSHSHSHIHCRIPRRSHSCRIHMHTLINSCRCGRWVSLQSLAKAVIWILVISLRTCKRKTGTRPKPYQAYNTHICVRVFVFGFFTIVASS